MKTQITALSLVCLIIGTASADVADSSMWKRNRVSVSFKATFNIEAEFVDPGSTFALSDPGPPTGSAEERTYDNGFSRVDITGNNHGGLIGTWYWDYSDVSQLAGGNIAMQSTSATASGSDHGHRRALPGIRDDLQPRTGFKGAGTLWH